jgi:hypothetical protein
MNFDNPTFRGCKGFTEFPNNILSWYQGLGFAWNEQSRCSKWTKSWSNRILLVTLVPIP